MWLVAAAGGPPRKLLEAGSPVWIDDATLVVSVERGDASRLAVVGVADPWPRRLATDHGDLEAHGDEWGAAVSPDRTEVAYVFTPARRPQPLRDPHREPRRRDGPRRHRDAADAGPRARVVARRRHARVRLGALGLVGAARRRAPTARASGS